MTKIFLFAAIFLYGWSPLVSSHFLPWLSWHGEALAFFAVFLFAWMQLFRHHVKFPKSSIAIPKVILVFFVVGVIVAIQGVAGKVTYAGDVWIVIFYLLLCIACVVLGFYDSESVPKTYCVNKFTFLAWVLIVGATVSTAVALCQIFSLLENFDWITRMSQTRRPGGNLAQPNNLATFLLMGIGSLIYLKEEKKLGAIGVAFLLAFLCVGLAMTESRAGAGGLILLMAWWAVSRKKLTGNSSFVAPGTVLASFLILFLSWPGILNSLLLADKAVVSMNSSSRIKIWSELLNVAMLHPWQGWGVREVFKAQSALAENYPNSLAFTYSHNIIMDLILWFGFPIALILTVMFAWWFYSRARDVKNLKSWYGMAIIFPLVFHSLFEFPYSYAYLIAPAMFMVGAAEKYRVKKKQFFVGKKLIFCFLSVASVVLLWSACEYIALEERFRSSRFEAIGVGGIQENKLMVPIIFLTQLDALANAARIKPVRGLASDDLLLLKNAVLHYPWPELQFRYALALALNGEPVEAGRQLKIVRNLYGEKSYKWMCGEFETLGELRYPELKNIF